MASPNDFFVQPGNDASQALSGLSSTLSQMRQDKERQRLRDEQAAKEQRIQERFVAAKTAAQEALSSGDPDKMAQVTLEYPEIGQGLSQAFGIVDADKKQKASSFVSALLNNPDQADQIYQSRIEEIQARGGDPRDTIRSYEAYKANPQGEAKNLQFMWAAMDKDSYGAFRDEQKAAAKAAAEEAKIARDDARFAQSEAGKDRRAALSAGDRALDREIKVLTAKQNAEMNDLKRQELGIKIEEKQAKLQDSVNKQQQAAESTVATFDQAIGSADRLLSHPGLEKAVGIRSALPTIPGSDAADFEAELDTLKAQTFLPQVAALKGAGALSDAEGKKLSDSIGALSTKMSRPAFEASLARVRDTLDSAKQRAAKKSPLRAASAAPSDGIPRPTTEAEYNAMPSGAIFIDPDDGQTYRKP